MSQKSWNKSFWLALPRTYLSIIIVYIILDENNPRNIVGPFPDSLWKDVLTVVQLLLDYSVIIMNVNNYMCHNTQYSYS